MSKRKRLRDDPETNLADLVNLLESHAIARYNDHLETLYRQHIESPPHVQAHP